VYLFERWIGIFHRGPDGGVEAWALDAGALILILSAGFPVVSLAFFGGVGLAIVIPGFYAKTNYSSYA
jgi:hypothetical protein